MIYEKRHPGPPLAAFIDNLWYWEGDDVSHAKDTIMASGQMGILINLKADTLSWYNGARFDVHHGLKGIALCGTHARAFAINAHQPHMMGVRFKPGGAFPFLGGCARDFENVHIAMAEVWGADAERLHQRLVQAPTPEDKFDILEAAMIAMAKRGFDRHPAVAMALHRLSRGTASVASLAADAEMSHKKFIRLFADEVGFTPKLYLRVARFQRVLANIFAAPDIDWGDAVEQGGYFDQSHFIRDFREFSGFTPTDYLIRRGPYLQHVPLVE